VRRGKLHTSPAQDLLDLECAAGIGAGQKPAFVFRMFSTLRWPIWSAVSGSREGDPLCVLASQAKASLAGVRRLRVQSLSTLPNSRAVAPRIR
jgi:hypothetical protein